MMEIVFYIGQFVILFFAAFAMVLATSNIGHDINLDEPVTLGFILSLFWNVLLLVCGGVIFLAAWRMG